MIFRFLNGGFRQAIKLKEAGNLLGSFRRGVIDEYGCGGVN